MFHKLFTHISSFFKNTDSAPNGYNYNEIEQALKEMDDHQENLQEILDLIKKSNFIAGDEKNIIKTIESLQHLIDTNEHQIQNEQKQATQYKKQKKNDKSKECLQKKKNILEKNVSILNVILFLENKQAQIQINQSIFKLNLPYLKNDDINENDSNLSDNDDNPNPPNEIQLQQNYFNSIYESIFDSGFNLEEEENINISINNLFSNLDENEKRTLQILQKSLEYKRQKENNQVKNYLRISQILTFNSNNIIQLISILQKKLTIIQINKSVTQLPIDVSVANDFPSLQSDESEQKEYFDKINDKILTAKFNSKDIHKCSNSVEHLKMAVELNEERIQREQQKIKDFKANKKNQFAANHNVLKTVMSICNENIREILDNLELQLEYSQQTKNASKLIKKYSKKNFDQDEMEAQIDEFNGLKDEFDELDDMMNVNFTNDVDSDDDFDEDEV